MRVRCGNKCFFVRAFVIPSTIYPQTPVENKNPDPPDKVDKFVRAGYKQPGERQREKERERANKRSDKATTRPLLVRRPQITSGIPHSSRGERAERQKKNRASVI